MATQYLDFATFQKFANAYAAVIDPINKTVDQLRSSAEAAKSGWEGTAYTAFASFTTQLEDQITKVNQDLTAVVDALNTGEKSVSTSDDESTSGFTSLAATYS
jgi:WXG100 family type VII secretion target